MGLKSKEPELKLKEQKRKWRVGSKNTFIEEETTFVSKNRMERKNARNR